VADIFEGLGCVLAGKVDKDFFTPSALLSILIPYIP
jgi:hypothetical protein